MQDLIFFSNSSTAPPVGLVLLFEVLDHTPTHHTRYIFPGREIGLSQRPVPHNTQHSQQTDIHVPAGFEPATPANDRPQTDALDRAATGMARGLTLRLLMSYIYGAPSKARNANVVYIWTYVWQR